MIEAARRAGADAADALLAESMSASVSYRLGILRRREAFGSAAAGLAVGLAAGAVLRVGPLAGHQADAVLALTLELFGLNVIAFLCSALVTLAIREPRGEAAFARYSPLWAQLDLQVSVLLLGLIWLMLL